MHLISSAGLHDCLLESMFLVSVLTLSRLKPAFVAERACGISSKTRGQSFSRGRTGAVVSAADYGPRGPWFETRQGRRSLWP